MAAPMPLSPSASLKCDISEISSTWGNAFRRVHAALKACGAKPKRFMPVFILRKTRCGWWVLCTASMSICASECTTCHKFKREHISKSRVSKAPSNKRMGPRQPSCRTRSASDKSSSAMPSAARKPSKMRSMPWPYALALTTAQTKASGAATLICDKLWRKAGMSRVA